MDEWIREHLKKCIRAERASKILTPFEEGLYFPVQECDDIIEEENIIEPVTFKCIRCGKRFTYYGEQARLLNEIEAKLREYRYSIGKQVVKPFVPTILSIVGAQARCCERPLILNTYPEKGEY